jgi:adenosylcobinamide-GDP ribazoletransferase
VPLLAELATCLRFFSRLPVPGGQAMGAPGPALVDSLRLLPLAGLLIGACTALPLAVAQAIGLPPALSATLGLLAGTLATGALHEDGLADTADGFGGVTRERKLAIMRDSRIGSFGVLALVFSVALRIGALAALLVGAGTGATVAAVLGAAALSRALALLPMATLPAARTNGLGHGVGRPAGSTLAVCFGVAALLGLGLPPAAGMSWPHAVPAALCALAAAVLMTRLASRQIGGHTGDVAGACQQMAEAAYLIGLVAWPGSF